MPFQKGNTGRPKGAQGKLTRTVKETVLGVFNDLQEDPKHSLLAFAKERPDLFYPIAAKLIPTEIKADVSITQIKLTVERKGTNPVSGHTPS